MTIRVLKSPTISVEECVHILDSILSCHVFWGPLRKSEKFIIISFKNGWFCYYKLSSFV